MPGFKQANFDRRRVLRGILNGGAVTVGLPLLNCFLNGNGNALASGEPMPLRFGTWFWGCGMNAKVFTPSKFGTNFEFPIETQKKFQRIMLRMHVFYHFKCNVWKP